MKIWTFLRIKVDDGIIVWVTYISLILLHLTYIYKISANNEIYEVITNAYTN
jgi:hypothetical protein